MRVTGEEFTVTKKRLEEEMKAGNSTQVYHCLLSHNMQAGAYLHCLPLPPEARAYNLLQMLVEMVDRLMVPVVCITAGSVVFVQQIGVWRMRVWQLQYRLSSETVTALPNGACVSNGTGKCGRLQVRWTDSHPPNGLFDDHWALWIDHYALGR